MGQSAIVFKSKGVTLDGVVASPDGTVGPFPGVVVCHPHPAFGGDMDNGLVMAVCRALVDEGFVTCRFNFRGVGGSGASFTNGEEEHKDVRAALELLKVWPGVDGGRLGLAGYSFGASMVATGLSGYKRARGFVMISPPPNCLNSPEMETDKRPKLVIVGDRDRLAPYHSLKEKLDSLTVPVVLSTVPGADHSWRGYEGDAALAATRFLASILQN